MLFNHWVQAKVLVKLVNIMRCSGQTSVNENEVMFVPLIS